MRGRRCCVALRAALAFIWDVLQYADRPHCVGSIRSPSYFWGPLQYADHRDNLASAPQDPDLQEPL